MGRHLNRPKHVYLQIYKSKVGLKSKMHTFILLCVSILYHKDGQGWIKKSIYCLLVRMVRGLPFFFFYFRVFRLFRLDTYKCLRHLKILNRVTIFYRYTVATETVYTHMSKRYIKQL